MSEKLSVVIITLNEEKNIRACLNSLKEQEYPSENYEVIVVDASRDATARIAARYDGVRVIKSQKGFSRQTNVGWRAARYAIVAFTDADCLLPKNWLSTIAKTMLNPEIVAIGGNALAPPQSNWFELCVACVGHPGGGALGLDANVKPGPQGISFIAGCNSAFRKSAIAAIGGFDADFQDGGEDVDLSRRLRQAGYRLDYIPELTLYHKPHTPFMYYIQWNIGVGLTKFSLGRPSLGKILFDPRFPLWSLICIFYWLKWFFSATIPALIFLATIWVVYLKFLHRFSTPFQFLLKRRRKIGLDLCSTLTMVPFLVLVRQLAIGVGQLKKWYKNR
ncbi:glycosyltransferase [bacterium]|nr:glycosyltransferase [bacterium]